MSERPSALPALPLRTHDTSGVRPSGAEHRQTSDVLLIKGPHELVLAAVVRE